LTNASSYGTRSKSKEDEELYPKSSGDSREEGSKKERRRFLHDIKRPKKEKLLKEEKGESVGLGGREFAVQKSLAQVGYTIKMRGRETGSGLDDKRKNRGLYTGHSLAERLDTEENLGVSADQGGFAKDRGGVGERQRDENGIATRKSNSTRIWCLGKEVTQKAKTVKKKNAARRLGKRGVGKNGEPAP